MRAWIITLSMFCSAAAFFSETGWRVGRRRSGESKVSVSSASGKISVEEICFMALNVRGILNFVNGRVDHKNQIGKGSLSERVKTASVSSSSSWGVSELQGRCSVVPKNANISAAGARRKRAVVRSQTVAAPSTKQRVYIFGKGISEGNKSIKSLTLAASFDIICWSSERQLSSRASSADVTTQTAEAPITFQVGETSLTLPFSAKAAEGLSESIDKLLTTFKEREKTTRPQRWQSMEYRLEGDDGVSFEFFCNPNAYANAFQAKVLITINDEKIKVTTEGQLSALKSDVDQYVEQTRYGSS